MTLLRLMAALTLPLCLASAAQSQGSSQSLATPADPLAGLWRATVRFGPDTRGPLLIERTGDGYSAEIVGRRLPVRIERGELVFDLPGGEGGFRGKLERDGRILGHWFRPGSPVNNAGSVSPVRLAPDGRGRWRGTVAPLQDSFTLYLLVRPRADGNYDVVLRNPDRDLGNQLGVNRLVRDGDRLRLIGQRTGQPEREIAAGRFDAENAVLTLFIPGRGGSYDFSRAGDESDFYPRGRQPGHYAYRAPPALGDGWPVATLQQENIDRAGMERFVQRLLDEPMEQPDSLQVHALLVARHGRLVLEEYFHGYHRDLLHESRSAGKSMASVTIGAALEAGAPLSLTSAVYQVMYRGHFPPDLDPLKRRMTLEHLLTMSSGYYCDDTDEAAPGGEEIMINQTEEPDYYRFTLPVPMATPPGDNSVYCSASPNLALGMLGRATGELPVYSFDRLVAEPLGIARYSWPLDGAGNPYGGGGVQLLPRDYLKIGQLMLNGGTWNGRRILGRDFARRAGSPLYHLRNIYYGYNWWVEDFPYKDRTVRSFSARGAGGQTIEVVPELDLVVVTLAANYALRPPQVAINAFVPRYILPAVREPGDDPNAPVAPRDFTSPYGRSTDGSRVTGGN
jgi:CubicO group peptidase (beta-lactamase class C family)